MDEKPQIPGGGTFDLQRAVFDNDLRRLSQIVKHQKEEIDKKVKILSYLPLIVLNQTNFCDF